MNKIFLFFIVPLFLSNCDKNISYGGRELWQTKQKQNEYNSSVFIEKNNSVNQNKQNNSNENYNGNGNNNYINYDYSSVNNNRQNDNNERPINIYIKNSEQPKWNERNNQDVDLESAIENSMNGKTKDSSLLEQDKKSGQIELSAREEFSNNTKNKQKVKYSIGNQDGAAIQTKNNIQNEKNNMFLQNMINEDSQTQEYSHKSYKIQCGYYSNKESANNIVKIIKNAGINDVKILKENNSYRILAGDFSSKEEGMDLFNKILNLNLKDNIFWSYR